MHKNGVSLRERGHIGFSPKKKNSIISSILGALAYNGHSSAMKWYTMSPKYHGEIDFEFKATERKVLAGSGSMVKEVTGYTPLMLAVVSGDANIDIVKHLIEFSGCRADVSDSRGNTLIHLSVMYNCPEILNYLVQMKKSINVFARNNNGETAEGMARSLGLDQICETLSRLKDSHSSEKVSLPSGKAHCVDEGAD